MSNPFNTIESGKPAEGCEVRREGGKEPASPVSRRRRVLLMALLAVEVLACLVLAGWRLPGLYGERWIQDDAYISFRYAKHLAQGEGLVYNPGEPVEGYTNFLWTAISTIPMAAGAEDPIHFMHFFSAILWIGGYALLLLLGTRLFRTGLLAAPLALIPLLFHWSYNMWFFSGMETPLVSFLAVLTIYCFTINPEKHRLALFWTSLSGVALIMTRPDQVFVFGAVAVAGLVFYWRRLILERKWKIYLLFPALPVICIYLPYTVWRITYYGSFYPNTYYAKVAYLTYYSRGWDYLTMYSKVYRIGWFLAPAVLGAALSPRGIARRFLWTSILATAFTFFYVVRLGGDFMEWRFVTPVTGVLFPAAVIGGNVIVQRIVGVGHRLLREKRWALRGSGESFTASPAVVSGLAAGLLAAVLLVLVTAHTEGEARKTNVRGQETISLLGRYCDPDQKYDWGTVGRVLDDVLPENVRIATTSAGIIPFFCDRHCLDLHGLNDPEIAREPVDPEHRRRMGHEHWLRDYGEMRRRGVDVYIYWADPKNHAKSLSTPPKPDHEMVSVQLPDKRYVEFLILDHGDVDLRLLRSDPRVVLYDPKNVAERGDLYALRGKYSSHTVVDRLDVEENSSESAHRFRETYDPARKVKHNFHTKTLSYPPPLQGTVLQDDGRRIFLEASWTITGVSGNKPLAFVARHDGTGGSAYKVEVNGREVPGVLRCPARPQSWYETDLQIPAGFLKDGRNEMKITRLAGNQSDAEIYYFWFLQPK